jgi:hypothetical protein
MTHAAHTDYTKLGDPQFFEERRHVRDKLERLPPHHPCRDTLTELLGNLNDEFIRRAREAWNTPGTGQAGD